MAAIMSASKLIDLLRAANDRKNMYVRVLTISRLGLGADPGHPEVILDLSREKILPYGPADGDDDRALRANDLQAPGYGTATGVRRRSGDYWFEINGQRTDCGALKQLLSASLKAFEETRPGTLEALSRVKARSRRIVARDPSYLYKKEHLAQKYAERLTPDLWYGTNNSAAQTLAWLRHACSLAGLTWGKSYRTSLE